MPEIKITDSLDAEILGLPSAADAAAALKKYLKNGKLHLLASPPLIGKLQSPLLEARSDPVSFGLTFKDGVALGADGVALSIAAGARGVFQVVNAGSGGFLADSPFGNAIDVPEGTAYAAFTNTASLEIGQDHDIGRLSFGFTAGGAIEVRTARRFDVSPESPTVATALQQVLGGFSLPGDVDDLQAMPDGTIAAVSGSGRLAVSTSVDLAAAVNPIATPELPVRLGRVEVNGNASLKLDVGYSLSGSYQIRVQKTAPGRLRLGYYKLSGSELEVGITAVASAGVMLRNREILEALIGRISSTPEADLAMLTDGGLSGDTVDAIQAAVRGAVDRSLSIALGVGLSSLRQDEAAFEYDVELDGLDATGRTALDHALRGDLDAMTALELVPEEHGIHVVRSQTRRLRATGARLKVNLLGIVNVLTVRELIRDGRVLVEPATGSLVIADTITSRKIAVVSRPLEADGEKLRKVMFETFVVTAALRAGALDSILELGSSYTFFEFHARTSRQTMSDHLDAVVAAGLVTESDKREKLGDIRGFGPSTFLLEAVFGSESCEALFLDAADTPHPEDFYDEVGREALAALVRAGDDADFRALPPSDPALWARMREAGPASLDVVLPPALRRAGRVAVIRSDFIRIRWWATSMRRVAVKLAQLRPAVTGGTFETLRNDESFLARHRELEKLLADVVRQSGSQFGDPWGLLALDRAARRCPPLKTALIVSPRLALSAGSAPAPASAIPTPPPRRMAE